MVEAVLCDIDGTLVESNWLHAAAWQDAFAEYGIEVDLEDVRRQIGKGGDELIPVFVPRWRLEEIEKPLKEQRKDLFKANYLPRVKPFPKVRELLLHMKALSIRVSLASSADKDDLEIYKKIANIDDLVEVGSSADDADRAKPHPDIFEATLKKLNLTPDKVLALGDTPYDAQAAAKAGISTIGVTTGGWSAKELFEAGVSICIKTWQSCWKSLSKVHLCVKSTPCLNPDLRS